MLRIKPIIEVQRTAYGGYDWILWLPRTLKHGPRSFYLGQDRKFVCRVLGMSVTAVVKEVRSRLGYVEQGNETLNMDSVRVRQAIAAFIIEMAGGLRAVRKLEAWGLCAQ